MPKDDKPFSIIMCDDMNRRMLTLPHLIKRLKRSQAFMMSV